MFHQKMLHIAYPTGIVYAYTVMYTPIEEPLVSNKSQPKQFDETDFELNLVVGSIFTVTPQEDKAAFESERQWVEEIQDLLRGENINIDLLANPGTMIWEGGIRHGVDLDRLCLIAAYMENGMDFQAILNRPSKEEDDTDPLLERIWEDELDTQFPHLIKHQALDGYYLPIDFPEPIWFLPESDAEGEDPDNEDVEIFSFGSAPALIRELYILRGLMQQFEISPKHATMRCLNALMEGAQTSVNTDLPLLIW